MAATLQYFQDINPGLPCQNFAWPYHHHNHQHPTVHSQLPVQRPYNYNQPDTAKFFQPLWVDTSTEYNLPPNLLPPKESNTPLLMIHPAYYEALRQSRTLNHRFSIQIPMNDQQVPSCDNKCSRSSSCAYRKSSPYMIPNRLQHSSPKMYIRTPPGDVKRPTNDVISCVRTDKQCVNMTNPCTVQTKPVIAPHPLPLTPEFSEIETWLSSLHPCKKQKGGEDSGFCTPEPLEDTSPPMMAPACPC